MLKAQIEIEYNNGKKETIITDETWKTNHGPIVEADILNGETYDARLEFNNWDLPNFNTSNWKNAQVYADKPERNIEIYPGNPVQVFKELKSKSVIEQTKNKIYL